MTITRRMRMEFLSSASRFRGTLMAEGDADPNGGGGGAAVDYNAVYAGLTPENKEVFSRRGFDKGGKDGGPADVNALFDTIRNQDGLIGKNNLAQPDMTQDDPFNGWDAGRKALGIIEKADEVKLKRPEMPKGADGKPIPYDEEAEKVLREALVGVLPAKYAQRVYDRLTAMQIARAGAFQQQMAEDKATTDAAIAKEWGGERDTKIARARVMSRRIAEQIGVDPKQLNTDANALLGSVGMLKMFDFLAGQFGEGFIKDGGGGDANDENTPAGAKAAAARMEADPETAKALRDQGHPAHAAAVKRRAKLYEIAGGGK